MAVGHDNHTNSIDVYNADQKQLVKSVFMNENTTYISKKDSKLTLTDNFVVLDLHNLPEDTRPNEVNVSFALDISKDPQDWGTPT